MDSLNQMELQDIRHTCGAAHALCTKIKYFKTVTNDENATQIMDKICTACDSLKNQLVGSLGG